MSLPTPMSPLRPLVNKGNHSKAAIVFPSHVRRTFLNHPTDYTGELVRLLDDISTIMHGIATYVASSDERMQYGLVGEKRVDPNFATNKLYKALSHDGYVCIINVKDKETPLVFPEHVPHGGYVVCLSSLDLDPTIEQQASCGTIFSVYKRKSSASLPGKYIDLQQAAADQVAAGVCVFAASTVMYYTMGYGLFSFCLHPVATQFFLDPLNNVALKPKDASQILRFYSRRSILKANTPLSVGTKLFCAENETQWYNSGGFVACANNCLRDGGLLVWPKLDILCEAAPLAFMFEQAGGKVTDGEGNLIMSLKVGDNFRATTNFVAGIPEDVDNFERAMKQAAEKKPNSAASTAGTK